MPRPRPPPPSGRCGKGGGAPPMSILPLPAAVSGDSVESSGFSPDNRTCRVSGRDLAAEEQLHHSVDLRLSRCTPQLLELGGMSHRHSRNASRRHLQPEVDSAEDRAGVHPGVAAIGPAFGRLMAKDRLAELRDGLRRPRRRVRLRLHGAQRAGHDLERRLHLRAIRGAAEELGTRHDASDRLPDVAVGLREHRRAPVDERLRRLVADEMPRELGRDERRRRRRVRDDVEHVLAVFLSAAGREAVSKHRLFARVVRFGPENESAALADGDAPTGQRSRHLDDVMLRVAAVHAQRVQLHQLAGVVLVETAPLSGARRRLEARRRKSASAATPPSTIPGERRMRAVGLALPVVEIEEHRRTVRDRAEQIAELAQRARTNDVAIVRREKEPLLLALVGEHREVILPEIHHHFVELSLAGHGPGQCRRLELGNRALIQLDGLHHLWIPAAGAKQRVAPCGRRVAGPSLLLALLISRLLHAPGRCAPCPPSKHSATDSGRSTCRLRRRGSIQDGAGAGSSCRSPSRAPSPRPRAAPRRRVG